MNSIVTKRFIHCIDKLIAEKKINSRRQFAKAVGYLPQGLSEIYNGRRDVTIELLRKSTEYFNLNPNYLLLGEGTEFLKGKSNSDFEILTIVTDSDGKERIVHVPVPAQAGYAGGLYADPVFIKELPTYNLPVMNLNSGTYRSFDVAGSSMEPTLRKGDKIVCAYIESNYWDQAIKNGHLYTLVTTESVVVKRCRNHIRTKKMIECLSDNPEFDAYALPVANIREIWKVRLKVSAHLDVPVKNPDLTHKLDAISSQLQKQNNEIGKLRETIRQHNTVI